MVHQCVFKSVVIWLHILVVSVLMCVCRTFRWCIINFDSIKLHGTNVKIKNIYMFYVQTWLVFVCSKYQTFWVTNDSWDANSSTVTSHCKPSDILFKLEWEGLVEEATQCAYGHAARSVFFLLTARKWSFQDPCLHRLPSFFVFWIERAPTMV